MAPTPDEIDALDEYTNAQMVKLLDHALVELVGAGPEGTATVAGRTWTLRQIDELRNLRRHYADLAAQDARAAEGGGTFDHADLR